MRKGGSLRSESGREIYEIHPPSIQQSKDREEVESSEYEKEGFLENLSVKAAAIGFVIFFLAVILITIALATPYWIESDRIEGTSRFERLGLWSHCVRSLPDPFDPYSRRFTAGCKVILGLFSADALEKRVPGLPAFFVVVQFMYTLCFLLTLVSCIMIPVYLIMGCIDPYHKRKTLLIRLIGHFTLAAAFLGLLAIIIFGAKGLSDRPLDYQNKFNRLSWSYGLAVTGVILELIAGGLFELEGILQARRTM